MADNSDFGTLGSARVSIEADLAPLTAQLEEAKAQIQESLSGAGFQSATYGADALSQAYQSVSTEALQAGASAKALGAALAPLGAEGATGIRSLGAAFEGAGENLRLFRDLLIFDIAERLIGFIGSTAEAGARIKEVADAAGLTASQYQVLRFAANQAGVEQDRFNTALEFFARNVGLIAEGQTTPAAKAMAALGISIRDVNGAMLPQSDILQQVYTALAQVKDASMAAAYAQELFNRGGIEQVNVAREIAEVGFAGLTQRAREMNQSIGDDAVNATKRLHEEFEAMSTSIQNDLIRSLVDLQKPIGWLVSELPAAEQSWGSFFRSIFQDPKTSTDTDLIANRVAQDIAYVDRLKKALDDLSKTDPNSQYIQGIRQSIADANKEITELTRRIGDLDVGAKTGPSTPGVKRGPAVVDPEDAAAAQKQQESFEQIIGTIQRERENYQLLANAVRGGTAAMREAERTAEVRNNLAKLGADATDAEREAVIRETTAEFDAKTAKDDLTKGQRERIELANNEAKANEEQSQKLDELKQHYLALLEPMDKYMKERQDIAELVKAQKFSPAQGNQVLSQITGNKTSQVFNEELSHTAEGVAHDLFDLSGVFDKLTDSQKKSREQMTAWQSEMHLMGEEGVKVAEKLTQFVEDLLIMNPLLNQLQKTITRTPGNLPTAFGGGGGGAAAPGASGAPGGAAGGAAGIPGLGGLVGPLAGMFGNISTNPADWMDAFSAVGSFFGFAEGGSFDVGGSGSVDSQLVAFKATPGEHVKVGQDSAPSAGGRTTVNVHNYSGQSGTTRESTGANGEKQIDVIVGEAMRRDAFNNGPGYRALQQRGNLTER